MDEFIMIDVQGDRQAAQQEGWWWDDSTEAKDGCDVVIVVDSNPSMVADKLSALPVSVSVPMSPPPPPPPPSLPKEEIEEDDFERTSSPLSDQKQIVIESDDDIERGDKKNNLHSRTSAIVCPDVVHLSSLITPPVWPSYTMPGPPLATTKGSSSLSDCKCWPCGCCPSPPLVLPFFRK